LAATGKSAFCAGKNYRLGNVRFRGEIDNARSFVGFCREKVIEWRLETVFNEEVTFRKELEWD